jgi:hypothetical protein
MNMHRRIGLVALLLSFFIRPLLGQECSDCRSRTVTVYDPDCSFPLTTTNPDSVRVLLDAWQLGVNLFDDFLENTSTEQCINLSLRSTAGLLSTQWAQKNPGLLNFAYTTRTQPPPGYPHYYLVLLADLRDGVFRYTAALWTSGDNRIVKGWQTYLVYGMGSSNAATDLYSQMQSLKKVIEDWEKQQRETYAIIEPHFTFSPERPLLDPGQSVKVNMHVNDCDGAPIHKEGLKVDLLAPIGGTIDVQSVTLDASGDASFTFTAGMEPRIGGVGANVSYTTPWGEEKTTSDRVWIQIKTPADSWSLHATYAYTRTGNTSEFHSTGTSSSSQVYETQANVVDAWLKRVVIPYTPRSYFVAQPTPLATAFSGHKISNGRNNVLFTGTNGYAKSDGWFDTFAQVESTATPTYALSINNSVQFSFQGFSARQTGMSHTTDESYDPVRGYQTSSSNTPAPLTTLCNWSTMGFPFDTSYSSHTFDGINYDSASYVQTCTWDDSASFLLKQEKHFVSESTVDTTEEAPGGGVVSIKQHSITFKTFRINIEMKYHKGTPDGIAVANDVLPKEYVLFHNYPNPFNPSTTISFSLPSRSFVSLKLFDALGREVAIVCSEELPAGMHSRQWNAGGFPSGVYFYRLQAGGYSNTKALQLLK